MTNQNLENKAKYERENSMKLPEKLLANCESCKKETVFEYYAIQQGNRNIKSFALYNCTGCKGTRSYNTLMTKLNGRVVD